MSTDATAPRESLRAQQRRLARERILEAAAAQVVTVGVDQLAMPAVARAAGVSLRTVYNHVDSREALLAELLVEARRRLEELGALESVDRLTELPAAIRHNYPLFGRLGVLGEAAAVIRSSQATARGRAAASPSNDALTAAVRADLADRAAPLDEVQHEALSTTIRMLVSSDSFFRVQQAGVAAEDSGEVTAWMVQVLLRALDDGDLPFAAPG